MPFETFLILILINSIQCSRVLDGKDQKSILMSDYCPKMKYCPEGAHVICMYYDQKNKMGPRCRDPRNVTMTSGIANKLLDVTNALRSKIAQGTEKGKNDHYLPRGYGIFRLKWDNELATFAQVLANQCLLRHDFCRATKRFPDPGQTAGIVRFHGSDWIPAKSRNVATKGLNEEKLTYAITQTLKTWYAQKSQVTLQMVTDYPDWSKKPNDQQGRLYLSMIYGSATHMGCGISAYTDYVFYEEKASLFYNTVLVICNFSAQPRLNAGVYNTVPPTDTDSSFNACGCPVGTLQDDDCLCIEVPRDFDLDLPSKGKPCPPGMNCDPTVVLLPIITVEDAPPDKLVTAEKSANASIGRGILETEAIIDSFEDIFDNNLSGDTKSRKTLELHGKSHAKRHRLVHSNSVTVRNRRFNKPSEALNHKDSNRHENKPQKSHTQRSSVFNKAPIFELPGSHYLLSSKKKDVIPRKDFSAGKQLVDKYLYGKNSIILPKNRRKFEHSHENGNTINLNEANSLETEPFTNDLHDYMTLEEHKGITEHHEEVHFHDILTTESVLNRAELNILNQKDSNELNLSQDADISAGNTVTDESDKKFMALLDTLEQEVKHIDLRDKEKQIFDAKIKKIYGKIVGKQKNASEKSHQKHLKTNKPHTNVQKSDDVENVVRKLPPPFDIKDDDSNFIDELTYQSKHNTDPEIHDEYLKTDITDIDQDDIDRSTAKKQRPLSNYDDRQKHRRNKNYRTRTRNHLSSLENVRRRYDHGFKSRRTYKNAFRNEFENLKHRSNSLDYKKNKNYYSNDPYDDVLSNERRNYYQDKLDNMERKLQDTRHYNRRKDTVRSPHMRALKPSFRSDNQMNSLYSGRARILHGY